MKRPFRLKSFTIIEFTGYCSGAMKVSSFPYGKKRYLFVSERRNMNNTSKTGSNLLKLVWSAACLALCMVLPLLTGQIPEIGQALSPMHIPVLLCGFLCGWPWGLAVGLIAPLLRNMIFGMPPLFPTGIAMAFELGTYGLVSGLLYKLLPKKVPYIYVTLITAMIAGRVIWGIVRLVLAGIGGTEFTFTAFIAGALTSAIPGIVVHIVLIPVLVMAMKKAKLILND